MSVRSSRPWVALFVLGLALTIAGLFVIDGSAGSIVLAFGLLAIFGAAVRFITRGDTRPPDERRVPAGHSGI